MLLVSQGRVDVMPVRRTRHHPPQTYCKPTSAASKNGFTKDKWQDSINIFSYN